MPTPLTIEDFKPYSVTCELRYKSAFLIFDRTGHVIEDLRGSFTDLSVSNSGPQQSSFSSDEGTFNIEIGSCRFTAGKIVRGGEEFAKSCKIFFDAVINHFQISVFSRIGLRYILRREFKNEDDAKARLASLMLANLRPARRFNSSENPTEVLFRWEDSQTGAFFRVKAETVDLKLSVPPELQSDVPKIDKKIYTLTLDIDYYTVAPVARDQWNCDEWVPQKIRMIRKEVDGILQGG